MASFRLYNCDVGIKVAGVSYDFDHVDSVVIEDPESNKLTRGANAGNKLGISYKEGLKEAKNITVSIKDMSIELKAVLDAAFKDKTRLDFYCVDRQDGSGKMGKNCVLGQLPQQLNLDDTPESLNVVLMFITYDLTETYKS